MRKFYILFIFLLGLFAGELYASHVMGGNITYSCDPANPNQYTITLALYRDCSGIDLGNTASVTFSAPGCASSITRTLNLIPGSGNDITPVCPQFPATHCPGSPQGTPMVPVSVEEFIYTGTVTLPSTNCNWTISYSTCCRNDDITTLSSPASNSFYISSTLNQSLQPCNNSPIFANPPVPFTCANTQFTFNHGVFDPDQDSLQFSLTSCKQSASSNVTYLSQFNANQPLTTVGPIVVDPATGDITMTPNGAQIGVICVKVEEFRNGVKIGEYVRDIQLIVTACNNPAPYLSGFNGTNTYDTVICAGQAIQFTINSNDPNPFQQVVLSWNQGIPGGTFTATSGQSATATFNWTPPAGTQGVFFFTVSSQDDGCPIPASNTRAYRIDIREPNIDAGPDQTVCEGNSVQVNPSYLVDFNTFQWLPTQGVDNPNIANPNFNPSQTTEYVVLATNGFCSALDTITIFVDDNPTLTVSNDVDICAGENTPLTASGDANSYNWAPNTGLSDPTSATPSASPTNTTIYTVTAISQFGCTTEDSVTVTVNTPPALSAGPDQDICEGESASLTASGTGTFNWSPAGPDVQPTSTTVYTVTLTDAKGCTSTDVVTVNVNPAPSVNINASSTEVAFGVPVTLSASPGGMPVYNWTPGGGVSQSIDVTPTETTTYTVTVIDAKGCQGSDTITILVLEGEIVIPNAFTPNKDGLNDYFYLLNEGAVQVEYFRIYNRWGQMIFESTGFGDKTDKGWNGEYKGEEQPPGNYTYVMQGIDAKTGESYVKSGSVTLLR